MSDATREYVAHMLAAGMAGFILGALVVYTITIWTGGFRKR
jgi:hypothetical protein